ncbi:uncharacterized protein ARMOST_10389 [Armillaria ostoyae]|uniref:Uncharacterized protein n=1 Tax=Armillaria ostoyae TaxID=47428 RepID=A0A284RE69_ARMOS|nr:uncharacterized protein ARMOST_10389 [Armillaria ostoyae]
MAAWEPLLYTLHLVDIECVTVISNALPVRLIPTGSFLKTGKKNPQPHLILEDVSVWAGRVLESSDAYNECVFEDQPMFGCGTSVVRHQKYTMNI